MRLITELNEDVRTSTIIDANTNQKHAYITGIFAQAEKPNRNKRIYPKKVLEKAISDYVENYVKTNRACGEIEHPQRPTVNMENACMIVESLAWDGNDVVGKARALTTPKGKILQALINDGVKLGVSTRGLGTVKAGKTAKNEDVNVVCDDYQIRAIDVVSSPSGIDCFVDGIMEGVDFYFENGVLCEREIEKITEDIKKYDVKAIAEDFNYFLMNALHK